jgi:FAD-dependent urate hydroxylase
MKDTHVAIIGSGPYAISLAAHLRSRGTSHRVFGPAMDFWRSMPKGLNLKSLGFATNICVPQPGQSFPEWCRRHGLEELEPCSMESYAAYGLEIQQRFVPDLEPEQVVMVRSAGKHRFEVTLSNGDVVHASNVVSATGLSGLAYTPAVLDGLGEHLTHTSALHSYSHFAGKSVAVIGAGASAIEAAALVHEAGGQAHLLVRDAQATFNTRAAPDRSFINRILMPDTVLGAGLKNWLLQSLPWAFYFIPKERRTRVANGWLPPTAPWWIRDRFEGKVNVRVRTTVVSAKPDGQQMILGLQTEGGSEYSMSFDHVIAGTGYALDVDRLRYLDADLRLRVLRVGCSPALSLRFESSVPGLYFVGPLSALNFGPVFRFVAGARFAAPAVSARLAASRAS